MKLLIENWRRYTTSLMNEDLIVESLEQAEASVLNRATKLIKGWVYSHDKNLYDFIENKSNESSNDEQSFGWKVGGYLILFLLNKDIVPKDIEENQKKIALMWGYRQLIADKDADTSLNTILEEVEIYLSESHNDEEFKKIYFIADKNAHYFKRSKILNNLIDLYFTTSHFSFVRYSTNIQNSPYILKSKLIENFFQWNRFIRDGKRDLNAVVDYDELYQLVQEARPLYQDWQDKQLQKDAEAGQELLLDDDNWKIIAIHNKGAACQLGKGTDWCTAAPGLEYFKQYYKPNDPLFYILDKSDGERYQFHFGSDQFMDKYDNQLSPSRYHVEEEIMKVLAKVVPQNYDIAYDYLNKYRLE